MTNTFKNLSVESYILWSEFLKRRVIMDFYINEAANHLKDETHLLLINDGQDLVRMPFENILSELFSEDAVEPVLCVGIHCGPERKLEYGVAGKPDYKGRGNKADLYEKFLFQELMPLIQKKYSSSRFKSTGFGGFSLGGLTALDQVWRHPDVFSIAGVFSGSLWWRSVPHDDVLFDEEKHRIMQQEIKEGKFAPGLRFFFETGTLDETADRNNNGIIDSIDDTLAVISELEAKGYTESDIAYLELKDGRHDVLTWSRAFPYFLRWAYGVRVLHS